MHLNGGLLAAAAEGKGPMRSPLAQQHNFGFGEDFLASQEQSTGKQGDAPFEKPRSAYLHEQQPEGSEQGDLRLKNFDAEFSRHFN